MSPEETEDDYRREYLRRKTEQRKQDQQEAEKFKHKIFRLIQKIDMVIGIAALVLILDAYLPGSTYNEIAEKGWQKTYRSKNRSELKSYMQTKSFVINVPHDVHLDYDYDHNPIPLHIEASPILHFVRDVSIHYPDRVVYFRPLPAVYLFGLPYIVLAICLSVAFLKYSDLALNFVLIPPVIAALIIVSLIFSR
jgi:hypothetical protein